MAKEPANVKEVGRQNIAFVEAPVEVWWSAAGSPAAGA